MVGVPAELAEDGGGVEVEVLEGLVEAEGGVQAGAVGTEEAKDVVEVCVGEEENTGEFFERVYRTGAELGVDEGVGMGVEMGVGDVKEFEEGSAIGIGGLGKGVETRVREKGERDGVVEEVGSGSGAGRVNGSEGLGAVETGG